MAQVLTLEGWVDKAHEYETKYFRLKHYILADQQMQHIFKTFTEDMKEVSEGSIAMFRAAIKVYEMARDAVDEHKDLEWKED